MLAVVRSLQEEGMRQAAGYDEGRRRDGVHEEAMRERDGIEDVTVR